MGMARPALGALVAGWVFATPAAAAVTVDFADSASYSDQALRSGFGTMSREMILAELRQHLLTLGSRYLPPNRILDIEVLDLRLAGHFDPMKLLLRDVRIMLPGTWPMIRLRYRLHENGVTLATAEETIRDLEYLTRVRARASVEPLSFTKEMLDDWFRERFAGGRVR